MPPNFLVALAGPDFWGPVLRTILVGGYLWSGIAKAMHFEGATREFAFKYKFRFPRTMLVINILVVTIGSVMMIAGWAIWLSAGTLGVFTLIATIIGYPFWTLTGRARMEQLFTFLEHVSLVGAFLLLAWLDLQGRGF